MPDHSDALTALIRATEELDLYDELPTVCRTHRRFIPCRHSSAESPCEHTSDPVVVLEVREYQQIPMIAQPASAHPSETLFTEK